MIQIIVVLIVLALIGFYRHSLAKGSCEVEEKRFNKPDRSQPARFVAREERTPVRLYPKYRPPVYVPPEDIPVEETKNPLVSAAAWSEWIQNNRELERFWQSVQSDS